MNDMPDRDQWACFDPALRMLTWIEGLPQQMKTAAEEWPNPRLSSTAQGPVVAAAMGGSAMAAEVALGMVTARTPALVIRTDTLPHWVDSRWLCIACSYSGNTRETLACYDDSFARGCVAASVSAGGVLAERAASRKALHRTLLAGQPPRTAVGQAVVGILWTLWAHRLIDDPREVVVATADGLQRQWGLTLGKPEPWETLPGQIAAACHTGYLLVVAAGPTMPAALRWSQQLNENAKVPCYPLEIPEMLHNHVEGLEASARLGACLVVLRDTSHSYAESAAMDFISATFQAFGGRVFEVSSTGESEFHRIFSLMYMGDQVSYLASLLRSTDPTPVERIAELKRVIASP
ncbi:hypothetical protein JXA88_00725 [Candidatus Fermentibacteria bacterium]|nr:hypothetical protein [Candidatus Fermentibacteria bacterium]